MKIIPVLRPAFPALLVAVLAVGCGRNSSETETTNATSAAAPPAATGEWIGMFNGKDFAGWKSNEETPGSFVIEDGAIKTENGRAHLFYTGPTGGASFKNFELKARVKHMPNSNSGIYFHTEYQASGWPAKGYECQVNSTSHKDPKKTGGLYAISDVMNQAPVGDDEWFDYSIRVEGRQIVIKIDGKTTVDWTEPADWDPATTLKNMPGRRLSAGTIALQGHDPKSIVYYKDIFIRPLP